VNRITIECDGLTAFLSPGPRKADVSLRSSEEGTLTFTGTSSYAETVALLRAGWPAGAEQARALSAQLSADTSDAMTAERPAPVWDVAGDDADVSRYLEGEPENMVAWVPEMVPAAGRVVRLLLGGRVVFHVGEEIMKAAAVMVAAAADALESRGVRVEVVVAYATMFGKTHLEIRHRLKAAEEALDLPRVVAGMHPSAFRRVVFRWMETFPDLTGSYGSGGTVTVTEGDVLFDINRIGVIKPADRPAWLREQAEAVLGIPA
jgi:hypothetical protein